MKKKDENIYENDYINDFKKFYIDYLKVMYEKLKIEEIKIIEINNINIQNYIICEYEIKKEDTNKEIKILNSHDEVFREDKKNYIGSNNEKEIKDKSEIK
jgi:hypothetical protein